MHCVYFIVKDGDDQEKNSLPLSGSSSRSVYDNSDGKLSRKESLSEFNGSVKPEMWRTWGIQRAGFSDTEFEGLYSKLCMYFRLQKSLGLSFKMSSFPSSCNLQLPKFLLAKIIKRKIQEMKYWQKVLKYSKKLITVR